MEQSQLETLRSLASLFPLPQQRPRRLLKSETFSTLVRMHSLFHDESRPTHSNKVSEVVPEIGFQNGKDEEEWTKTIEPEPLYETTCSTSLETEILPIQKCSVGSGIDACVNVDSNGIGGSENSMNNELIQDVVNELGKNLMDDGKKADGNICLGVNQEHGNLGIDLDIENEKGKDFSTKNDSSLTMEAVVPAWDMDSMFECLMHDEKDGEENSLIEQKISNEIWQEDSMELEKFLSGSNINELSHKDVVDEEMEEGEIMYEVGDLVQPLDSFLEEAGLSENMKDDEGIVADSIRNLEPLTSNNTDDINQKDLRSNEPMLGKDKNLNFDYMKEDNIKKADGNDFLKAAVVSKNQATTMPHESDIPESHARILEEIVAETETAGTVEKVADTHKKRKRGPEAKQRKKKKERIKRAENNRRLGVKRLKIVPISKPKAIVYCRHFVKGRCHEGENCKFSHDIVPTTKSQPCCHFARHTCMKGDDCPFDHELSKYPCNNYISKGYCSRGSECLFSHQVPPTNNSSETTAPELKPSGLLENKGPQKQLKAPSKKNEKADAETILKHPVKGIDKLLFGIGSLPNHSIGRDSTGPCIENHGSKAHMITSPNSLTESRRVNFLSFGKSPVKDLKTNGSSNLLYTTRDNASTNIAVAASSLLQKEGGKSEMPEKPTTQKWLPRGINFMSFGSGQTKAFQDTNVLNKKILQMPISTESDKLTVDQNEMPEKPSTQKWLPRGINFMSFGQTTASQESNVVNKKILQMPVSIESDDLTVDLGKGLPCPASKPPAPLLSTSTFSMKGQRSNSAQKSLLSMIAFADKYQSRIKTMDRAGNVPAKES
ncbi:zinc finger CCCH domain-containing protein 65 [Impatiens glandulifera]|uniref:zinc finger CCCH domain-containing protein 65 n=1 Tax=Impatiens glandulifera TaxID=253017 RepID=UPI001FB16A6D|nr:zinc finger CCCH domain-containing protein 65 [Impatiens glandulifera]XP_047321994.1 zinc finger CCCH domain-containing protein 65 [Impatiens glandulifera]XP_047321995.1 zinc finger CCCH domain-containing protein 65 [Impatiens glandulifera]XP_047321996.1 zinc finger CCCH domain-containing protein 65 [Impatiens glandulifera]XP_047321997.1 zinc finger CCCH domain-containing protein 65 [Impatiens glandulifera]XP_047321998.1 zinc finger CCCH domain-containing protein 65 [Impatiens glandulifera]